MTTYISTWGEEIDGTGYTPVQVSEGGGVAHYLEKYTGRVRQRIRIQPPGSEKPRPRLRVKPTPRQIASWTRPQDVDLRPDKLSPVAVSLSATARSRMRSAVAAGSRRLLLIQGP